MREMISYPHRGSVDLFTCTDCAWIHWIQQFPSVGTLEEQREYAEGRYKVHDCLEFPRKDSKIAQQTETAWIEKLPK